jgi:hypothetical protein
MKRRALLQSVLLTPLIFVMPKERLYTFSDICEISKKYKDGGIVCFGEFDVYITDKFSNTMDLKHEFIWDDNVKRFREIRP